jgi:hypothetical protein
MGSPDIESRTRDSLIGSRWESLRFKPSEICSSWQDFKLRAGLIVHADPALIWLRAPLCPEPTEIVFTLDQKT